MDTDALIVNSQLCRLCSEENKNGINLYSPQENSEDLCSLVNRYLPIKVDNDDQFPKTICPGCHIQLEATKLFMDLIIEGQGKLRDLLTLEQELLNRGEKERQKLEQALHNHNPNASVETYTIQEDENGEKYIIQIYSDGPLFSPEHELVRKAEGLDKPKRKRGRPPKVVTVKDENSEPSQKEPILESEPEPPESLDDPNVRKKRKIRPPVRYQGVVQGKELAKIFEKEGVIDEETDILEDQVVGDNNDASYSKGKNLEKDEVPPHKTIIGTVVRADGEEKVEQYVFMKTKSRNAGKRKGVQDISLLRKYKCDICLNSFQHLGRYKRHKRGHRLRFGCQGEDCSIQSEDRAVILEHQKESGHVGISTFEKITKLNGTVLLKSRSQTDNTENTTDTAPTEPEPEGDQANKSFKCEKCDKSFTCRQNYEVHMKATHEGEKPFKCQQCKRTFAYLCSLKKHIEMHRSNAEKDSGNQEHQKIKCPDCDKVFHRTGSLMYHRETDHGNFKFICNKCDRSFKHRQLLLRHQLVHTEERPFQCEDCGRQFKSKTNLITHENIHKGIKKFVCPICGNTFLHKTSLWVHLKWHNGSKPYECDVCKKSFTQKGNLLEHQRIHTGEKPFTCSLCSKSFTTSSQCRLHMKRHTGEKPYACKYCSTQFLHKDTFETHVRRHLDLRPFQCKFCPKAFSDKWSCTKHERIHLGLKKYKCQVCDKAFSDSSDLSKHKKIHLKNGIKPENLDKRPEDVETGTEDTQIRMEVSVGADSSMALTTTFLPDAEIEQQSVQKDVPVGEIATPIINNQPDIQIQSLLDSGGTTFSITTTDGQPIPIVSSGSDKFQGVLPDGTLVSFDIVPEEENKMPEAEEEVSELATTAGVDLLNTEIQFLEENTISNANEALTGGKPAYLSEDGKILYITAFDEGTFLPIN